MRRKNNTVIAILIISLLFITGCGGSKIALSKEAKEVIKKYKLDLSLVANEDGKRNLKITNTGTEIYEGTILADFDKAGYEDDVIHMVTDTSYDVFCCSISPGKTVTVYMSIYDEYQLENDVLYLDMDDELRQYVGKDSVEHWFSNL